MVQPVNNIAGAIRQISSRLETSHGGSDIDYAEQERQRHAAQLWIDLTIPRRHREAMADDGALGQCKPWAATCVQLCGRLGKGYTVVLHGTWGNGKTQLAVAVLKRACERRLSCRFTDAISVFIRLRETYRDGGPRESAVIKEFTTPAVLVIDEAHERAESAWENRTLTHIINKRYEDMKDTILIMNLDERSAAESLGRAITSRMMEGGAFVHCDWPSFRGRK